MRRVCGNLAKPKTRPLSSFSELCWGKSVVAYTKPQQRKKEESERLRGERDQIKFAFQPDLKTCQGVNEPVANRWSSIFG